MRGVATPPRGLAEKSYSIQLADKFGAQDEPIDFAILAIDSRRSAD